MGLPAGRFHEVFQGGAAGPLDQFQHLGFTALADTARVWAGQNDYDASFEFGDDPLLFGLTPHFF